MAVNSLRPLKPRDFDYWKAHHLLNRAGFGGTPDQVQALASMGLDDAVDYIVEYESIGDDAMPTDRWSADIMRPPTAEEQETARTARRNSDEATLERLQRERNQRQAADRKQMADIQKWWIRRMIETGRPLEEKMTLFWHGHFATSYRTIEDSWHMVLQNQFLRANATGSFAKLCFGIIRDPAMLEYLDNDQNRRRSPNENLARELMELFILGEGHDYTEQDIKEGARALTGYTFRDDAFVFNRREHDDGQKRILGKTGSFDGEDFVRLVLARPVASEFIAWKLYRFFVNDLPGTPDKDTQGFIVKLAKEMRDRDYQLKPVLRALFRSEHFYDPDNTAALIKSPVQLVVQAIRSMRTPARDLSALAAASDLMGQNLFFPPNVKGWDGGRAWINTSTLFVRQNIIVYLLTGKRPNTYAWQEDDAVYDPTHLLAHLPSLDGGPPPVRDATTYLLRFMLGSDPRPERVDGLVAFVERNGGRIDTNVATALVAVIAAFTEYQLC
ncbi:MAG: DUF1800 domain-containing protein [Phycisphaerales bacterium]|nr:DUF1800 domain-containing protein [Phycisphaerales bacterium]